MPKMHEGEVAVDETLARRLIASQFPRWSRLPLAPVEPAGTDHAIYRLGDDMAARFPRIGWAAGQPAKEFAWLPRIASHLSVAVPEPLALGDPTDAYPFHWLVCTWLEGDNATPERLASQESTARDLARLLTELEAIDTEGGPPAAYGRGAPLETMDEDFRASLATYGEHGWLLRGWQEGLDAPAWREAAVWLHGDLDARNLLASNGHLSGLLDFGGLSVGDPAGDAIVAWKMLDANGRRMFRELIQLDAPTWLRARATLVAQAVMILSYYTLETNPTLVREATNWLAQLRADE
jgi:aminoglycoside phosphotransferase (APT) family kinase protein